MTCSDSFSMLFPGADNFARGIEKGGDNIGKGDDLVLGKLGFGLGLGWW